MSFSGEPAGAAAPARATVAIGLASADRVAIAATFEAAGYGVALIDSAAALPSLATVGTRFAAAILEVGEDAASTVEIVRRLRAGGLELPVVYVTSDAGLDAISSAGVDDTDEILLQPVDVEALRWRVEAMAIRAQVEPTTEAASDTVLRSGRVDASWAPRAPIFALFNPKGGVGKTTIATNLAAALQIRKHRRVLLVDADTVTGHVALSLGMQIKRTVSDSWQDEAAGGPRESLLQLAVEHASGVRVAPLTSNPLTAPHLDPERVADSLLEARDGVDAIVVDLHPSYSDVNLAVFTIADKILVPVTPDLPAIRAAMQLRDVAYELGVRERLAMVVNRAKSGVSVADIERTTGLKAFAEIRSAGLLLVWAANAGKTLIDKYPREKVTGDFDALAERLLLVTGAEQAGELAPAQRLNLGTLFRKASAPG
ncbi:MAG TPA: AAA family ATPase [Candidatus Limnocylindrales bacterium]|nr:AAA family ATPase [Candidatus Limnocylindrales bacterium]